MGTVKFKTKSHADVLMLKSDAEKIFTLIHRTLTEQGTIDYQDLPSIQAQLRQAITAEENKHNNPNEADTESETNADIDNRPTQTPVTLKLKLFPLLKMMQASYTAKQPIYWGF